MVDYLLTAKIHIAPVSPNQVMRQRLLERLSSPDAGQFVVVAAPAGSGKTTLIQQWLDYSKIPAAWVSLDEGDNDLRRFLTYVVAALQTIDPDIGETTASLLNALQLPPLETLVAPLIHDLSTLPQPLMLVLDDYHIVSNLDVHKTLNFLLDNAPPRLYVVISSREDPPIPIHRLRVSGQLTEIRASDLRFTLEEAYQFFEQTMSLDVSEETAAALEMRTEGWVAGLQMAALSMRDISDIDAFVKAFTGDHRFVADYLISEVLDHQPDRIRDFLLQTSILNRFNATLCEALIGDSIGVPAHEMIENIETLGLFIVPLDHVREWYRYHHLFADLLRHRLERRDPDRFKVLHRRASQWYEAQQLIEDAVHHALMGEDYDRVADLLEQNGMLMIGRSQLTLLQSWIDAVPDQLRSRRPYLSILLTWVGALTGQADLARTHLLAAQDNLDFAAGDLRSEIICQIALLHAYAARSRGDLVESLRHSENALEHLPKNSIFLDCTIHLNLGGNYWLQGDFLSAEAPLKRAMSFMHISEVGSPSLAGAGFLTNSYLHRGQIQQAVNICQEAIWQGRSRKHPSVAYVYLEQGELLYEQNQLEAAVDCLEAAIRLGELTDKIVNVTRARLVLALVHQALGNPGKAAELVEQAAAAFDPSGPRYLTVHRIECDYYRLRCLLGQQDLFAALQWSNEYARRPEEDTPWSILSELTYARVLFNNDLPHDALSVLTACEEPAQSAQMFGWVLQNRVLQALCYHATGDQEAALDILCKALSQAEPEGYVRIFVDMGQPMAVLLTTLLTCIDDYSEYLFTSRYVSNLLTLIKAETETHSPLAEPLTNRELDILRLLTAGLSNKEIADQLVVSLGTVKQYNHAIYRKLDVRSRDEAAQQARRLNLI